MPFLDDTLPGALLDAVHAVISDLASQGKNISGVLEADDASFLGSNSGGNSSNIDRRILNIVAARYPLTGIWPLAILLSLASLAILSLLLKLAWSLFRAKLSFFQVYKIHYGSASTSRHNFQEYDVRGEYSKTRTLVLPAQGSVLVLALFSCIASVANALSLESNGRIEWINGKSSIIKNVEFTSIWLAVLFLFTSSISYIPLFTSRTSPAHFISISPFQEEDRTGRSARDDIPVLSKKLAKPLLPPLLVNGLVVIAPVLLCVVPIVAISLRNWSSTQAFRSALVDIAEGSGGIENALAAMSSTNETSSDPKQAFLGKLVSGMTELRHGWQVESLVRGAAILALLGIIVLLEHAAQKRLTATKEYLEQVEEVQVETAEKSRYMTEKDPSIFGLASLDELVEEDACAAIPSPSPALMRNSSFLSSGSPQSSVYLGDRSPRRPGSSLSHSTLGLSPEHARPTSRASTYRSFSSSSASLRPPTLYVPELPELDMDLPSPSMLKEDLTGGLGGASPYSPALVLFEQRLDRSFGTPSLTPALGQSRAPSFRRSTNSLHRGNTVRSEASSLACSDLPYGISEDHLQVPNSRDAGITRPSHQAESGRLFSAHKLHYEDEKDSHHLDLPSFQYGSAVEHLDNLTFNSPYGGVQEYAQTQMMPHTTLSMSRNASLARSQVSHSCSPGLYTERRLPSFALSSSQTPTFPDADVPDRFTTYRPQSRASSYSYVSRRSQSQAPSFVSGRSSSYSYASRHSARSSTASWRSKLRRERETYQGPTSAHVAALKKGRAVDAALIATFVLALGLLEMTCAGMAKSIPDSRPLQAVTSFASILLKLLPILGGVILSAMRSSSPAYGWTSRHIMVGKDDNDERDSEARPSLYRADMSFERGVL